MSSVLDFFDESGDNRFKFYRTRKFFLSETADDVMAENSDKDNIPLDKSGKIAETDLRRIPVVDIPERIIKNKTSYFSYFLDGSRHVYKVDDIAIGAQIFPVMAGQIVVGCCQRINRDTFKSKKIICNNILSLPKQFNTKGKESDFSRDICERLNKYLKDKNMYACKSDFRISDLVLYKTDGSTIKDPNDKNKYRNSAIAQIQNKMIDLEQIMVDELCKEKVLNDDNWLIKDGSIQYNPSYSSMTKLEWNNMRANYSHVIGVSKSFDPQLLNDFNGKKLSQTIASLKPWQRTKAYTYLSSQSDKYFAIWYLRLRKDNDFRETRFSDVVKCELLMLDPSVKVSTDLINDLSASLINEAYPVCYGNDSRWGNHLYPIYLTETFCKSKYLSSDVFLKLF